MKQNLETAERTIARLRTGLQNARYELAAQRLLEQLDDGQTALQMRWLACEVERLRGVLQKCLSEATTVGYDGGLSRIERICKDALAVDEKSRP